LKDTHLCFCKNEFKPLLPNKPPLKAILKNAAIIILSVNPFC